MANYPNVTLTSTSTNENSQYLRSNFIGYSTIKLNNVSVVVPDILNTNYLGVINNLQPNAKYTYTQGQQITTQAYYATGNTSTWWMICLQNGTIHPLQMQNGDIVFVPNVANAINGTNNISAPPSQSTVSF
ncbi:MAG: hypothetical protein KGH75_03835 [Rhodospirillales bacterium]|nr:hypothetical protein [Rhodospirillales bacterium]